MSENQSITKTDEQWRQELTPAQYRVLRQAGTEAPFTGEYFDCHDDGVYRCAACGAELFASDAKFDSGTGWPSFTEAAVAAAVDLHRDFSHGMVRTEVRCRINSCALELDRKDAADEAGATDAAAEGGAR